MTHLRASRPHPQLNILIHCTIQVTFMENSKALVIGGSRNIGYHSAIRLLGELTPFSYNSHVLTSRAALGATVTFLLRSPQVFEQDDTIQQYIKEGKAHLVQGDALVKSDVSRAWSEAQHQDGRPADFLIFTVGASNPFYKFASQNFTHPYTIYQAEFPTSH